MIRPGLAASFSALLVASGLLLSVAPVQADTETCVGHAEFDNTQAGLTPLQVANRYDVYGVFLDDTNATFRRGYRTCWAPGVRQVVVVFSYDTNTSTDWYVRDI